MVGVGKRTLQTIQYGLENAASLHCARLAHTNRRYCDWENSESTTMPKENSINGGKENHDLYAVDKIIRHTDKGSSIKYFVRWYGYSKADDTAEPLYHIPQHFIDAYWRRIAKKKTKRV